MSANDLFSREEALGGLPARRASTLLFVIESHTARLVARARRATQLFIDDEATAERDLAFVEAFATGREPPLLPTIQDLERHAPQWSALIPETPNVRAALANALSKKYRFTYPEVPSIREALGLDQDAVKNAYRRSYREPLESVYAARLSPADRLRWAGAAASKWLETMPTFWTAFAFTLTETAGVAMLALPIATASIGPLPGIAVVVLLGLVNLLTVVFMAEASARSGAIRYGHSYIGRMVRDYLGHTGALVLSFAAAILAALALQVCAAGFADTLAHATPIPAAIWMALLFLFVLYFLRPDALNATVASALVLGGATVALILLLSLLALTQVHVDYLTRVNLPFFSGAPFRPEVLKLIFGVVLFAYLGHLSVTGITGELLRRNPSTRPVIAGTIAGMLAVIVLYSFLVLAINGALGPEHLEGEAGTFLPPLAVQFGPGVQVLGALLVILTTTMPAIHNAGVLFELVRERLPKHTKPVVLLPRRRGHLVLESRRRNGPRVGITFLGQPETEETTPETGLEHFRLDIQWEDRSERLEIAFKERWEDKDLLQHLPELEKRGVQFALEIVDANPVSARLRVNSPMRITYEGEWDTTGLHLADVMTLPETVVQFIHWMMRQGEVSLGQVMAHTELSEEAAREMLSGLMEQGFVREVELENEIGYRAQFAPKRGRKVPKNIWKALDESKAPKETPHPTAATTFVERALEIASAQRFWVAASPVALVFLWSEWLVLTDQESFAKSLEFIGVIFGPFLGGIFPVLLLIAGRRKGEFVPDASSRAQALLLNLLGHPVVLGIIVFIFWGSLLLHGLVILENPLERTLALLVAAFTLVMFVMLVRGGNLAPRLVVMVRQDLTSEHVSRQLGKASHAGQPARFTIMANGQPAPADVRMRYPDREERCEAATGQIARFPSLWYMTIRPLTRQARELKVWAHQLTAEGDSESLPVLLQVQNHATSRFDLQLSGGQAIMPMRAENYQLRLTLRTASGGIQMAQGLFGQLREQVEARERVQNLTMTDIFTLPEPLRTVISWIVREREVSFPDLMAHLGQDETRARALLTALVEKGLVQELNRDGELSYRVRVVTKPKRQVSADLLRALEDKSED